MASLVINGDQNRIIRIRARAVPISDDFAVPAVPRVVLRLCTHACFPEKKAGIIIYNAGSTSYACKNLKKVEICAHTL